VDSGISTEELADLLEEFKGEVDVNGNIHLFNNPEGRDEVIKLPESEGSDEENNLPDIEQNELDGSNDKDEQNEKDIIKDDLLPNSPRTYYVTRSGRPARIRKDLYEDYDFCQTQDVDLHNEEVKWNLPANASAENEFDINSTQNTPHIECSKNEIISHFAFTQYSLKQGLQLFPVEARSATIADIQQLYNIELFEPLQKSSLTQQELMRTLSSLTFIKQKDVVG
jgi:hypothetical protein